MKKKKLKKIGNVLKGTVEHFHIRFRFQIVAKRNNPEQFLSLSDVGRCSGTVFNQFVQICVKARIYTIEV